MMSAEAAGKGSSAKEPSCTSTTGGEERLGWSIGELRKPCRIPEEGSIAVMRETWLDPSLASTSLSVNKPVPAPL